MPRRRLMPLSDRMAKGDAVLFSEMTPPEGAEDAFNRWQDTQFLPVLVDGVSGILSAMRYKSDAGPYYLSILELAAADALDGEAAQACLSAAEGAARAVVDSLTGCTRYLGIEGAAAAAGDTPDTVLDAPLLRCEFLTVPFERSGEFEDRFDREEAPALLANAGSMMVRRLDLLDCDPEYHTHLVLHYLGEEAGTPPGARRIADEPWCDMRAVTYRRHGARIARAAGRAIF